MQDKRGTEGKEFEGQTVKINLTDGFFYTVRITEQSDTHLKGIDKFGQPVMFNYDSIATITPSGTSISLKKEETNHG